MFRMIRTALVLIVMMTMAFGLAAQLKTNPKGIVGKIENKSYTFEEYNSILDNYYSYWQAREGRLNAERKKELNNRLWDELVARALYDSEVKRRRINVSDQEAIDTAIKNPPMQVTQLEVLKTDGKFDPAKFKQALDADQNFRESVANLMKESMIYDRLFAVIKGQVRVKADSLKNVWIKNNNTADAKVIVFDYNTMPKMDVDEADAIAYYDHNIENYKRDPARRYRYVEFTSEKYITEIADSLYLALLNGADFAELARLHSEDPGSGQNGGDLGWFGRGRMVKEFEDTAFSLAKDEISRPVKSQFGLHIIQTLDMRKNDNGEEEVQARHILVKSEPNDKIKEKMLQEAEELLSLTKAHGILQAAYKQSLLVAESDEFYQKDRNIKDIGPFPDLISGAFSHSVGYIPGHVTARNGDIFVTELSDSIGYHYSPYEKNRDEIIRTLEREKRIVANRARAHAFFDTHAGEDYIAIAESDSIKIVEAIKIKDDTSIPEIGMIKQLNEALLSTEQGKFTPVVEGVENAYLAYLLKREKPNLADWEKQKNKIIADERERQQNQHLNMWYYQQKQKVKVEDNRKDYYELPAPGAGARQIQINPN